MVVWRALGPPLSIFCAGLMPRCRAVALTKPSGLLINSWWDVQSTGYGFSCQRRTLSP